MKKSPASKLADLRWANTSQEDRIKQTEKMRNARKKQAKRRREKLAVDNVRTVIEGPV